MIFFSVVADVTDKGGEPTSDTSLTETYGAIAEDPDKAINEPKHTQGDDAPEDLLAIDSFISQERSFEEKRDDSNNTKQRRKRKGTPIKVCLDFCLMKKRQWCVLTSPVNFMR